MDEFISPPLALLDDNFKQYKKAIFRTFRPLNLLSWSRDELFWKGKVVSENKKYGSKILSSKKDRIWDHS